LSDIKIGHASAAYDLLDRHIRKVLSSSRSFPIKFPFISLTLVFKTTTNKQTNNKITKTKLDQDLRKFEQELEQKELNLTAAERRKRKSSTGLSATEQRKMFVGEGNAVCCLLLF
jgi:hypothetical protein